MVVLQKSFSGRQRGDLEYLTAEDIHTKLLPKGEHRWSHSMLFPGVSD